MSSYVASNLVRQHAFSFWTKILRIFRVMKLFFANVELIIWLLVLSKLNQSPSIQIWWYSCRKMEYECKCLLHDLPKCAWVLHTKCCRSVILQVIHLKLCTYTAAILWTLSELQPEWLLELGPFSCISNMLVEKTNLRIFFYQIYCVILAYIQFTVPQTSKCFLSNGSKNMHILASGPELQAVCNDCRWNEVRTKAHDDIYLFKLRTLNKITKRKKQNRNSSVRWQNTLDRK